MDQGAHVTTSSLVTVPVPVPRKGGIGEISSEARAKQSGGRGKARDSEPEPYPDPDPEAKTSEPGAWMGNAMNAICRHAARASQINLRHSTPVCSREGPNLDHTSNLSEMASKVSRHFVGGMPDHESNCCCQQRRVRVRLAAGVFKGECTRKMSPSRRRAQGASEGDGGFMERFNQSPCGLLACEPAFHSPTRAPISRERRQRNVAS